MALTQSQIASRLFKKSLGKAETTLSYEYSNEEKNGRPSVFYDQIWSQSNLIPNTADTSLVTNASATGSSYSVGVVKYYNKLTLSTFVSTGNQNISFYSDEMMDSIPFNFGDGSYTPRLYKSNGDEIFFGVSDWLLDTEAGVLTFYSTPPSGVNVSNPPKISFYKYIGDKGFGSGSGTITGITAGAGLTGGGTSGNISLSVNLGINSGLTFSGDDIILDGPNLAGTGLSYSNGVLSVTTSQFTSELAGSGLVDNGSQLDVNVDISGLTVSGDMVRLQDIITGDRRFQDSVRIDGNLTVYGTTSYIYTENILVEDNILTLNATYSGPYNTINTGIEANLGGGTYAALIWDYTNSLWSAGFSGSVSPIITEAGTGLTKSGNQLSVAFYSLTGQGLTTSGTTLNVNTGTGLTISTIDNSLSLVTTSVIPSTYGSSTEIPSITVDQYGRITGASTYSISIPPQFEFSTGLTANGLTVSIDFQLITGAGLTQNGSQIFVDTNNLAIFLSGAGLTQNGGTISVNVENGLSIDSNKIVLGGDLTKDTIISGTGIGLTFKDVGDFSVNSVSSISLTNGTSSINFDLNGMNLESDTDLNITATSSLITINNGEGLVYSATPSNSVPLTLIHKQYVDNQIGGLADVDNKSIILNDNNEIQINPTVSGQGLTFSESTGIIDIIWGGTQSGLTFSGGDSLGVNVDGTTIQINVNGELTVVAGASTPVYDLFSGVNSLGDNSPTGVILSYTPNNYSRIEVYVNGQKQRLGNGVTQSVDCYFDITGKELINLTTGDELYWNGLYAGYDLSTSDSIEIVYEK